MTATAAKTPNAAQISRVLNKAGLTKRASGKNAGYVVKTQKDTGKVINHTTGVPDSYRYPIVSIEWEEATAMALFRQLVDPGPELGQAEEALKAAGYHVEQLKARGIPTLIAMPQELLDWRAEREERAAKADELAEAMIPACEEVIGYQVDHIAHVRRHGRMSRPLIVGKTAAFLRNPTIDVLDREAIAEECRWYDGIAADSVACGFRMGSTVVLIAPITA